MADRRLRSVSELVATAFLTAPLLTPTLAGAEPLRGQGGVAIALPTLGPLGFAGIAAGAAGLGLLISRNYRKHDDD